MSHEFYQRQIDNLKYKLDVLEQIGDYYLPSPSYGFTKNQSIIWQCLREDKITTIDVVSSFMDHVDGSGNFSVNSMRVAVSKMRKKLKEANAPYEIETIHNAGWRIVKK